MAEATVLFLEDVAHTAAKMHLRNKDGNIGTLVMKYKN